ncbi:hypothetical protein [Olivibacter domesticus]|uniref:Uncharacterized protein n=1 Tax=Olivibacter domesticus TaxID=407022 RepID=A0A1H7IF12_OLID1|nr:hypothetical protein [Olivibacter domesticus]SEK61086.1 hypothetical protein SAMN05661044_00681 [Olivibacter domesticus]
MRFQLVHTRLLPFFVKVAHMENRDDHNWIMELMIAKLSRNISRDEERYLDELIATEAHIQERWMQLVSRFSIRDIIDNFKRFDKLFKDMPRPWERSVQ